MNNDGVTWIKICWFYLAIKKNDMAHSGKWIDIGLFTLIEVRQTHEKGVLWRKGVGGVSTGAVVGGECAPSTLNKLWWNSTLYSECILIKT